MRSVNAVGLALCKSFEGLKLVAYLCPAMVWTIGYGHTRGVYRGMTITAQEAEQLLQNDLDTVGVFIMSHVTVELSDNQFSALCCLVLNIGVGAFSTSTLLRLLNRGWYDQIPGQFMRWNKINGLAAGGLTRRRAAESKLWETPDVLTV